MVTDIFHITDWFPTILDLAGFNPKKLPKNLDGKSQRVTLEKSVYEPPRTKFIYGVIDYFDKDPVFYVGSDVCSENLAG